MRSSNLIHFSWLAEPLLHMSEVPLPSQFPGQTSDDHKRYCVPKAYLPFHPDVASANEMLPHQDLIGLGW
jgi:hypothetical protein